MKVVFLEEVEGSGRVGEVREVADGFARNYLLPRRLAAPATSHYISIAQARAQKEALRQARLDEEAQQYLLPKLDGQSLTIEVRVGEQGKLFGSVTTRDIAEEIQRLTNIELEHRQIDLREPIRQMGSYSVTVKLSRNVAATVQVNVVPLGAPAPATEAVQEMRPEEEAGEAVAEAESETEEIEVEEEVGAKAEAETETETEAETETETEAETDARAEEGEEQESG